MVKMYVKCVVFCQMVASDLVEIGLCFFEWRVGIICSVWCEWVLYGL